MREESKGVQLSHLFTSRNSYWRKKKNGKKMEKKKKKKKEN
jgi:hypothetical protein